MSIPLGLCSYNYIFNARTLWLHSKKTGVLPNPQKRFRRCLKVSEWVQSLKKGIKYSTKPLKVLPVCPREEPSPAKPFSAVWNLKKGFTEGSSRGHTERIFNLFSPGFFRKIEKLFSFNFLFYFICVSYFKEKEICFYENTKKLKRIM